MSGENCNSAGCTDLLLAEFVAGVVALAVSLVPGVAVVATCAGLTGQMDPKGGDTPCNSNFGRLVLGCIEADFCK